MSDTDTKVQPSGFRLRGKFYPWATNERLTDAPLLELVCGIKAQEWRRRYIDELEKAREAEEEGREIDDADEIVSLGSVAVAISREHPKWSSARVADFIREIGDWDELEAVNPVKEVAKESPPADGAPGETSTSQSSETSNSGSESPSETSETPPISGTPTLVT